MRFPGRDAGHEVGQLGAVLLTAQVEADRLGQLRRVADVPARLVALDGRSGLPKVDLDLLPVGIDPPRAAPDRHGGRHLPMGVVRPVDRQLAGHPVGEPDRAVDLVLRLGGEDRVHGAARHPLGRPEEPGEQVDRVRRVVVECAAPGRPTAPPGTALGLEDDRPVGLGHHVRHPPDRPEVEQPLHLGERGDVAVVVPDLRDEAELVGGPRQLGARRGVERERLLAEHVDAASQRRPHHVRVEVRRRGDDDRVGPCVVQHRLVVRVGRDLGVLAQDVEQVRSRVAHAHDVDVRMSAGDRQM